MKDFIKWLGVNEKVAKIAVWMFIIMVFLIIINAALDSLGFPYYKITAENISNIDSSIALEYLSNWLLVLLNFYSIIFLIFRVKEFKKIAKYSIIYLISNILVTCFLNQILAQLFIIIFIIAFSYYYSKKNKKYILYSVLSILVNFIAQYISYIYKVQFISYDTLNYFNRIILSGDYFIFLLIIITIKEIYLNNKNKKRG